jgi:hypothetical protein
MFDKLWDFIVNSSMTFFLPLVCSYFALSGSLFFNVACEEAYGLEKFADQILAPSHYLFMGRIAKRNLMGEWDFHPRYEYQDNFAIKTASSALALLPSFLIGSAAKAAALLQKETRKHHHEMKLALESTHVNSNLPYYESLGIHLGDGKDRLVAQGHKRRPGDENNLAIEKEAFKQITTLLTKANIPWWIDCGTCLGAYRYGGAIPWDEDIDLAVLQPDFDNICRVLNQLDPNEYVVQDWSSRDFPKSYLKVYVRRSKTLIDIYHFAVDPEKQQATYILALETNFFFPEWWKIRERRFKTPAPFAILFPLKKATFDGIEVNVPNDTVKYLQRYYGENLAPAKIYDEVTGQYEKDLTHPYWQRAYVH